MKAFRVNADYEYELFHQKTAPPAINQTIEFFLFFLSTHPLYSQRKYSAEYLKYVEKLTGRVPQVVNQGVFENFWGSLNNRELEKWWNSKITSTELIIQKGWCVDTQIIHNPDDLKKLNWNRDLLIKDPYGMSGQKFQLLGLKLPLKERQDSLIRALQGGPLIVEPWFKRKYDFSQYIFSDGQQIAYQNLVNEKFQYKGTVFNNLKSASLKDLTFYSQVGEEKWSQFCSQTQAIIYFYSRYPNECGYSIDSFIYEEAGELKIRVMSEINYRRTMGRTAYELSKKFATDQAWSALVLIKTSPTSAPLWKSFPRSKNVMVLSPGDSRFEVIYLSARDKDQGFKELERINALLPDGQFTIKL